MTNVADKRDTYDSFATLSASNTLNSTSFISVSNLSACKDNNHLQRNFIPAESTIDMVHTDVLADRNTIVDMSLRLVRFVICVIAALIFAFGFALLTSNKKTLTYVYEDELAVNETLSTKASSVVENYNTLFGYLLFAGGKIFEVFCETLIFPTLATYLHNCSLYPGDQPARMHSVSKTRCIFWGLKTVIILMNVGFTSLYVGKSTLDTTSRRLTASDELTEMLMQMGTPSAVHSDADMLHSILRTSLTGFTMPFEFDNTCDGLYEVKTHSAEQLCGVWIDNVDTTSLSFSFPSHAWNTNLFTLDIIVPTKTAEIVLQDYMENRTENAITGDWDYVEMYWIFQQSIANLGLAKASGIATFRLSLDDLILAIVADLRAVLPSRAQLDKLVLGLQHRNIAEDVDFTTLLISVPIEVNSTGTTLCGASGCVYATPTSILEELHLQQRVSIASADKDENAALVYCATSQYVLDLDTAEQAPHEVLIFSLSLLTWKLRHFHIAACASDVKHQCLGLILPLATGKNVLLVGKENIFAQHAVYPVALVTLHPAVIPNLSHFGNIERILWHRIVTSNGKPVRSCLSECITLVDSYLKHLQSNHFYLDGQRTQDMFSAALFYLLQHGSLASRANVMSRRRLLSSTVMVSNISGSNDGTADVATTDIEVNVPTATALVTLAGCIFIVVLTLCVIYLPTSRVKLSPDTTPAAQYVQILTDDLYSDLVHTKHLRFANGDCLLFNEYVVDAIVLHAKRDQTKKVYL